MVVKPVSMYSEKEFLKTDVKKGAIVLATVTQYIPPTLYCEVKGSSAIMNIADIDEFDDETFERRQRTAKTLVGKKLVARVVREVNGQIVLERRTVMKESRECLEKKVGKVVECTIESFASFGLFVDIGNGVISMIPNVEISKSRYYNLKECFNLGDILKVKILNYDIEKGIFIISRKQAYNVMTEESLPYGSIIMVSVRKYVDETKSGVFVEYDPGNSGIMDIPDWADPDEFYDGRAVAAIVKAVKPQKGIKVIFYHFV